MDDLDKQANANHNGGDEDDRFTGKSTIKDLWMEICEGVETSDRMAMLELVKEDKLQIISDMSAREVAEGRLIRQGRGSSESYSIVDGISNMQKMPLISQYNVYSTGSKTKARHTTDREGRGEEEQGGELRCMMIFLM